MSQLTQRKYLDVIDVFGYRYILVEDERFIATDPAAPAITRGPFYRCTDRESGRDLSPGRVFMPDEYYLRGQLAIPGSMYTIEDAPSPDDKKFRAECALRVAAALKAIQAREAVAKSVEPVVAAEPAPKPAVIKPVAAKPTGKS